jgi:hypothetical protein
LIKNSPCSTSAENNASCVVCRTLTDQDDVSGAQVASGKGALRGQRNASVIVKLSFFFLAARQSLFFAPYNADESFIRVRVKFT